MQEASLTGFFKAIVYMIGFYYLIKILARIFMPILMKKVMNKAQENFNKHYQQGNFNQGFNTPSQEPEKSTRDFKKPTKQVGDYVDYEEVKD
jgi:uncharacterized protein YbcC (UPF0753/DUF2309 family)